MSTPSSLPSGWFPDPHGRHDHRWFNGTAWTADVADDGRRLVDPHGAAPLGRGAQPGAGNGLATAALICGLIALVFAWMPVFVVIGIVLGVLGVVLGLRGRRRARTVGVGGGPALTGVITGATALGLSIVGIVLTVTFVREVSDFMSPGPFEVEVLSCEVGAGAIEVEASLTNLSRERRSYTVYGVVRQPGGIPDLVADVAAVDAGATVPLTLRRTSRAEARGTCDVHLVVHGPTPYGLDMERIND